MDRTAQTAVAAPRQRRYLAQRPRQLLLFAHIAISVSLLGDSAGFLAVALRAASADPATRVTLVEVLNLFASVFGIPLSVGALATGVGLGLGTKWGVFRYPWVIAKLLAIISVMLVGGVVIGPALEVTLSGGDATTRLIAAAAYDVCALTAATWLSVFKPGRARGA